MRISRRWGRERDSCASISVQRSGSGVEGVAVGGRFLRSERVWRDERKAVREFQRLRAAVSAARMVSSWSGRPGLEAKGKLFAATSPFCSFMRVLRRVSKVLRWRFSARPFAMSVFLAWERVTPADCCSDARILRRVTRSESGEEEMLLVLLFEDWLLVEPLSLSLPSEASSSEAES